MYSSEYTSGASGPTASHLAAPPSPRHDGNVGQALSNYGNEKGKYEKEGTWQDGARENPADRRGRRKGIIILIFGLDFTRLHQ